MIQGTRILNMQEAHWQEQKWLPTVTRHEHNQPNHFNPALDNTIHSTLPESMELMAEFPRQIFPQHLSTFTKNETSFIVRCIIATRENSMKKNIVMIAYYLVVWWVTFFLQEK